MRKIRLHYHESGYDSQTTEFHCNLEDEKERFIKSVSNFDKRELFDILSYQVKEMIQKVSLNDYIFPCLLDGKPWISIKDFDLDTLSDPIEIHINSLKNKDGRFVFFSTRNVLEEYAQTAKAEHYMYRTIAVTPCLSQNSFDVDINFNGKTILIESRKTSFNIGSKLFSYDTVLAHAIVQSSLNQEELEIVEENAPGIFYSCIKEDDSDTNKLKALMTAYSLSYKHGNISPKHIVINLFMQNKEIKHEIFFRNENKKGVTN